MTHSAADDKPPPHADRRMLPADPTSEEARLRYEMPPAGPRVQHVRRHLPPTLLAEPRVIKAVRRIEQDLPHDHQLAELARANGLSPFHFHRLFAEVMGEALSGFIRRQRLDAAAIRLAASELSMLEIGTVAGYGSLAAFSRAFQRQFGVAPTVYRPAARAAVRPPVPEQLAMADRVRLERWEIRPLVGLRFHGGYDQAECYWARFADEVRLRLGLDPDTLECYALIRDNPLITAQGLIRYDCCFADPGLPEELPAPFARLPPMQISRCATLLLEAPYRKVFAAYRAIANVWTARHGEHFAEAPAMERYHAPPWRRMGQVQSFSIMVMLI